MSPVIVIIISIFLLTAIAVTIYLNSKTSLQDSTLNQTTHMSRNTPLIGYNDDIVSDTIAQDVLDHIDCNRVARISYQSPAHSECGYYSAQQFGSPALKYPTIVSYI
jgi:hypothetical protein